MGIVQMQSVNPEFWAGKRVLITGHTGFKGSWLSLWLQMMNAEVFGFALPSPTEPALFEEADVESGMESIIIDIRDFAVLQEALEKIQPDNVLHMAAQTLVR